MITVSVKSLSAAAAFFSLALTLAVVDRTAVATLVTASFFGAFVGAGFAFDTKLNFGGYGQPVRNV
jgi:hypothetical protein